MKVSRIIAGLLFAAAVPFTASAALIAEQPVFDDTERISGDSPIILSGASGKTPSLLSLFSATGTVRKATIRYDMKSWTNPGGMQVYLYECPLRQSDSLRECHRIVARDPLYGWDGVFIHPPVLNIGELSVDFTSAVTFDVVPTEYFGGVPLNPTRGYRLEAVFDPGSFVADIFGFHGTTSVGGFYPYYKLEGDVPTSTPATTTPTCTQDCNSNVMFLPGIEGSRLYRTDAGSNSERRVWEPSGDADATYLNLGADGKMSSLVYTRDVIDEAYVAQAGPNIYKSFLSEMNALKSSGKIADWAPVPYDWRLSIDDILSNGIKNGGNISYTASSTDPYVLNELVRLASTSRTGKVTIVAHSNGGLVAKALMQRLGASTTARFIDKVILVDVPQVGTPAAIGALLHGENTSIPLKLSKQAGRTFAQNAPMTYNLLPSASYFTYVDDPVVTFSSTQLPDWVQRYGSNIHSKERLHTFLSSSYGRTSYGSADLITPTSANDALLTQAEQMHAVLDAWVPPVGVKIIQIAGWGIPTTIKGFDYTKPTAPVCNSTGYCTPAGNLTMTASTTIDGDGTVVTPSQLWISNSGGNVEKYWMNLNAYNSDHPIRTLGGIGSAFQINHKNILEIENLLSFISDTLINKGASISTYRYVSVSTPVSTERRLRYELHSPLSLDAYDYVGNHTGISTTTGKLEEQIPGTYFMEYGDVKYLFTATNIPTRIVMSGFATSTFTFKAEELQGDTPVTSTTFQDIPTSPTTRVTISATSGVSSLSAMNIDKNSDGIVDARIAPKTGGAVTLDTIPPEASIGFSTSTKRIIITGIDDQSTPIISTTTNTSIITDTTGNFLKVRIEKDLQQANAATLTIQSLNYSTGTTTNATTFLRSFWAIDKSGKFTLLISAIKTPTERTISIYTSLTNQTYLVSSSAVDDSTDLLLQSALLLLRQKLKILTGVVIPQVITKQGTILIKY